MTCKRCDPDLIKPNGLIRVTSTPNDYRCIECGDKIMSNMDYFNEKVRRWDHYFHRICIAVASKSPCLSRQIGAILVRDKSIVSTGYNGPARGYPHCESGIPPEVPFEEYICPRKLKGYASGEGLHECPAAHAEGNCIANAARNGVSTTGTTLYMNCMIPCKDCAIILVNAGITEIVVDDTTPYHQMSIKILDKVKIRSFKL